MKRYVVEVTDNTLANISQQARYIAVEAAEPEKATRWLESIWDAVDSLEVFPKRCTTAEENAYVEHDVRQLVVGSHLLLFTVDDETRTVSLVGLRHGRSLPRQS